MKYPSGAPAQVFPEYVYAGHFPYTYYGRPFPYPKTPYYHSPYYQDYYYHYSAYYPAYEPFVYNSKPEIDNIDDLESKNVHYVPPANCISAENSVKPIAGEIYPHPLTHDLFQNTDCKKIESVNRPTFYNQLPPFRENSPFDSRLHDAVEYRPGASSTAILSPVKESGYGSKREYESGSCSKTNRINEKYYPKNTLNQDSVAVPFASSYPPNIYKNRAFSLDTTEYRVFDECNNGKESLLPTPSAQSRRSPPVESHLHQQGYMQKIPPIQVKKEGSVCESSSSMADHPRRKLPRIETLECFRRNQNDMRSASSNITPYSISSAGQDVDESDKTATCPL